MGQATHTARNTLNLVQLKCRRFEKQKWRRIEWKWWWQRHWKLSMKAFWKCRECTSDRYYSCHVFFCVYLCGCVFIFSAILVKQTYGLWKIIFFFEWRRQNNDRNDVCHLIRLLFMVDGKIAKRMKYVFGYVGVSTHMHMKECAFGRREKYTNLCPLALVSFPNFHNSLRRIHFQHNFAALFELNFCECINTYMCLDTLQQIFQKLHCYLCELNNRRFW